MHSYFARSGKDTPKRYMAWLNWGGDSGKKWVDKIMNGHSLSVNPRRRRNARYMWNEEEVLVQDKGKFQHRGQSYNYEFAIERGAEVNPNYWTEYEDFIQVRFWKGKKYIGVLSIAADDKANFPEDKKASRYMGGECGHLIMQLIDRDPSYDEALLFRITKADIEPPFQGKGLGQKLYTLAFNKMSDFYKSNLIIMAGSCWEEETTNAAFRVWKKIVCKI